jgi:hypothetical protein
MSFERLGYVLKLALEGHVTVVEGFARVWLSAGSMRVMPQKQASRQIMWLLNQCFGRGDGIDGLEYESTV